MRGDVSSDIKCRGEGNGLDVITQSCWCRQEWRVGVVEEVVTVNKQGSLSDRNKDFRPGITVQSVSKQITSAVRLMKGGKLNCERNLY